MKTLKFYAVLMLLITTFTFNINLFAGNVDTVLAKKVAKNFYLQKEKSKSNATLKIAYMCNKQSLTNPLFYIYNVNQNDGFVIVSAIDNVSPILGYSNKGKYTGNNLPPAFSELLEKYSNEIGYVVSNNIESDSEIKLQWKNLKGGQALDKDGTSVNPLITTTWGQGCYYNSLCPADATAPECGYTYTGCAATAMAQIMKYWNYPTQGTGTHSYSSNYGTLSADFAGTTYDWNAMTNNLTSTNNAVATLMNHCGVAIDMQYGPTGSGAYVIAADASACVENALKLYFGYSTTSLQGLERANYSDASWTLLLKAELNAGRPIQYAGWDTDGGHTFVCDGFDSNDNFHINWGWGGSYDGFFNIDALNAGGYGFNANQQALIGIQPVMSTLSLSVSPANQTVNGAAGSTSFNVTSSISWTASCSESWCTVTPSGTGNGIITVNYSANTGSNPSTAIITVSASGANDQVVILTQSGMSASLTNDECSDAILLTQSLTFTPTTGTTIGATSSIPAITCGSYTGVADDDVWYKFVAASSNPTIEVVCLSGFDAVVDLRSGSCTGTNINCSDAVGTGGAEIINATNLSVGATYYIRVYSYGASTNSQGAFGVGVFGSPVVSAPVNDECSGAILLTQTATYTPTNGTTAGATQSLPEACCSCNSNNGPINDVWYKFIATTTDPIITAAGGSGYRVAVNLRSGSCNGTYIDCISSHANGTSLVLNATGLTIGDTYYVRIFNYPDNSSFLTGTFTISVFGTSVPPVNDACSGAIVLTQTATYTPTNGTTVGATKSLDGLLCGGNYYSGAADDDVWYKFLATSTNPTIKVVCNYPFNAVIDLRSGSCNGTHIDCIDATLYGGTEVLNTTELTIGEIYYIRIYSYYLGSYYKGTFSIGVYGASTPAPVNDNCSGATLLTQTSAYTPTSGTTIGTTQSIPAINCGGYTGSSDDDVWYKFVATSTDPTIKVEVPSLSLFYPVVDLRSGSCSGTNIDCAYSMSPGGDASINATGLSVGSTYYVRVYSFSSNASARGPFTIGVYGNSAPSLTVSPANQNVSEAMGTVYYTVISNVSWTASSSDTWCTVTPSGTGNGAITVNYSANTGSNPRTATITITGSGIIQNVTVNQSANTSVSACGLQEFSGGTTAPSGWVFTNIGGTYTNSGFCGNSSPSLKLDATGDAIQTASVNNPSLLSFWLKGSSTNATTSLLVEGYDGTLWATVDNITNLPTTGTTKTYNNVSTYTKFRFIYTKSAGNLALDDINITCGNVSTLSVSPANQNVTAAAGSAIFNVTSNTAWTVSCNQSWCTPVFSGNGSGTITANYSANTANTQRTATITVSGSGVINQVVTVTQSGISSSLIVSPANQNVTATAGSVDFNVTSNIAWTAASNQSWCTVTPSGNGNGTITANYSDNAGISLRTATITVSGSGGIYQFVTVTQEGIPTIATPEICIVSIDSVSGKNIVVWDKPASSIIDHFNVYRESLANVYTLIGTVPYSSISTFVDYTSVPAQQSYRYKLSATDNNGNESVLSSYHQTIHLFISQGVGNTYNLSWGVYEGFTYQLYNIYRGTNSSNLTLLTNIPSTNNSYTDINPPSGYVYYQIEAVNPNPCSPSKTVINSTKSNIANNSAAGIGETENSTNNINVYPNPSTGVYTVECSEMNNTEGSIKVYDNVGKIVLTKEISSENNMFKTTIDISELDGGIYMIKLETPDYSVFKKVIKW